jgi:hypothetical protein
MLHFQFGRQKFNAHPKCQKPLGYETAATNYRVQ